MTRPRVLLLGQYPLGALDRAPKVRTYRMAEALARQVSLEMITGTRGERGPWLRAYQAAGKIRGLTGVYLESASSTMTVADWQFLRAVRRAGVPLAIFVRDWYQRFPDLYPPASLKERGMALLYRWTLSQYARLATTLFFPTDGLAALLPHPNRRLLPPAGSCLVTPLIARKAYRVLYVGANGPHDGVVTAVRAMGQVASLVPGATLTLVMRRAEWPTDIPAWCELVEASGEDLEPYLWSSAIGLIPRRDTAYNRLAMPVKLFDYLSHGLPVVTTEASDAARFVVVNGVGHAVPDDPAAYAHALVDLFGHPERLETMRRRALELIREQHNWDARAEEVLRAFRPDST